MCLISTLFSIVIHNHATPNTFKFVVKDLRRFSNQHIHMYSFIEICHQNFIEPTALPPPPLSKVHVKKIKNKHRGLVSGKNEMQKERRPPKLTKRTEKKESS